MTPWQQHVKQWKDCQKCPLCTQRKLIVLARGSIPCELLFVGEAPGDSENLIGQPFVGPAGKLLDRIIEAALLGEGPTMAFTNLVACYPKEAKDAGENEPDRKEIEACRPRLEQFIKLCSPRLIVAVGKLAEAWLPEVEAHTTVITHPAAILRMSIAQKDFAFQKCIITIRTAVEEVWDPIPVIPF